MSLEDSSSTIVSLISFALHFPRTSNSTADVSRKSNLKFDSSKASSSKSVKEAQPKKLSEQVSKTTDVGDFELPAPKLFEAKLDLFEGEEVDAGDELPHEENIPALAKSSRETIETEEEPNRPPPENRPVSRTQEVDPKPVSRTARNISPHFQNLAGTRNKPSPQQNPEVKRRSAARAVCPTADDHLKPGEAERRTAAELLRSKSIQPQYLEQQHVHISEPVSEKTTEEFCRPEYPEAIKSQRAQLPIRDAKRKESSPVPAAVDESFEVENDHSQSTPMHGDEENAAGEKKATEEGSCEEDTRPQSGRLEHKDEAPPPITNTVHTAAPSLHEEEAASQEAFADAGDCGPASALPASAASQQSDKIKTAHISTQETSVEAKGKDGHPRKENTRNKTSSGSSIRQLERRKSSIIPRSNLPFGKPLRTTNEHSESQDVGAASTRMQLQFLGSKEGQSTTPRAPRKRSPREGTAGQEVHSTILKGPRKSSPIEETAGQDQADGTSRAKRKLAPLPSEEKKEKKQVRFQEGTSSPQPQPTQPQMLKDDGKKQTTMRKVELLSTGFSSLQSSRLGLTASTSVNSEQPVLVNRAVNRTKESTAMKTHGTKTGFFAKSRKRVHIEELELPSKRHGLAELANRKNVQANRSTSEMKFAFEQVQVGKGAPRRTSTKDTTLQLALKTTVEPDELPPASASPQKTNEENPTADASLEYSSKKSPEQKLVEASGTPPPEENQEALEGQALEKLDDTGSDYSVVKRLPSTETLTSERRNIMEQANMYSDKLEEMIRNLKRLNNHATDLVVRALICNNKLLMMQSPRTEEKISSLTVQLSTQFVTAGIILNSYLNFIPKRDRLPGHDQRVRKALQCLSGEELKALLRVLPASDLRSLLQEIRIHCAYGSDAFTQAGVSTANGYTIDIHSNWNFLPRHRVFVYFHERILQKLLDDPTFQLAFLELRQHSRWDQIERQARVFQARVFLP
ncbi:hypothetical protein R1sor_011419 [Riccia sorocarpa]|uniref:Tyrosinase copper-binding domain-containing protein n=1 Tax=Riccia sorocarpa TaxID=122646 RepID=A0ABD3I175_9MARC